MDALKGVLFAAGRGERLRPLTDRVPKAALSVAGTPLGAWPLHTMLEVLPEVLVNVAHLPELVEAALVPYAPPGALEFFREAPKPYGTAGTLRELRARMSGPVLTYNSDVIAELRAGEVLELHRRAGVAVTLSGIEVGAGADLAVADGRATGLIDRHTTRAPGVQFTGMAVIEPAALDDVPPGPQGLAEAVFPSVVEAGEVAVFVHDGYFIDVGTPERYARAIEDVRVGRAPRGPKPLVEP